MWLGRCHQTLVKSTQQKKKTKQRQEYKQTGLGIRPKGKKKKRNYELYLFCPRSFTAFASACGYLFTKGQIAGSARSLQLPASHQSRHSCRSNPGPHPPRRCRCAVPGIFSRHDLTPTVRLGEHGIPRPAAADQRAPGEKVPTVVPPLRGSAALPPGDGFQLF